MSCGRGSHLLRILFGFSWQSSMQKVLGIGKIQCAWGFIRKPQHYSCEQAWRKLWLRAFVCFPGFGNFQTRLTGFGDIWIRRTVRALLGVAASSLETPPGRTDSLQHLQLAMVICFQIAFTLMQKPIQKAFARLVLQGLKQARRLELDADRCRRDSGYLMASCGITRVLQDNPVTLGRRASCLSTSTPRKTC